MDPDDTSLKIDDLPLGIIYPDAAYNRLLLRGIETSNAGQVLSDARLDELENARRSLWAQMDATRAGSLNNYARHAAGQYGFELDEKGGLCFPWKQEAYRRVGYESDFFASRDRALAPVRLDHERPRVIVFATGRAFAERNARLLHLSPKESLKNARFVMSAQVYLVSSRLVRDPERVQVVAAAYDMVTSEDETPALRIQSILEPDFIHPACATAAERIFGPMIADADMTPEGTFARKNGRIDGRPLSDERIIAGLSSLVLVGGSVGCIAIHQILRCLDAMLAEFGRPPDLRQRARSSFLVIHLGPTAPLTADPSVNTLSVVNRHDEFVFAGNDTTPLVRAAESSDRRIVPGHETAGDPRSMPSNNLGVLIDTPATLSRGQDGPVFDPIGTHFGHSMKHYTNSLRDMGVGSIVDRALKSTGPFELPRLIAEARRGGELNDALASEGH